MKTYLAIVPFALALAACARTTPPPEIRVQQVQVQVRAPCPDRATYGKLKATRPVPLRAQPMPGTKEERVGQIAAQLGRYEAVGGWGDQVSAVLDRCQEGVAP